MVVRDIGSCVFPDIDPHRADVHKGRRTLHIPSRHAFGGMAFATRCTTTVSVAASSYYADGRNPNVRPLGLEGPRMAAVRARIMFPGTSS